MLTKAAEKWNNVSVLHLVQTKEVEVEVDYYMYIT